MVACTWSEATVKAWLWQLVGPPSLSQSVVSFSELFLSCNQDKAEASFLVSYNSRWQLQVLTYITHFVLLSDNNSAPTKYQFNVNWVIQVGRCQNKLKLATEPQKSVVTFSMWVTWLCCGMIKSDQWCKTLCWWRQQHLISVRGYLLLAGYLISKRLYIYVSVCMCVYVRERLSVCSYAYISLQHS